MRRITWTLAALLALVAGAAEARQAAPREVRQEVEEGRELRSDYVLRTDDRIRISWFEGLSTGLPENRYERDIRRDGRIFLPIVGEVVAAGKTMDELEEHLTRELATYIVNPVVYVELMRGTGAYLMGAVRQQGFYPVQEEMTLVRFLAVNGGILPSADLENLVVVREGGELIRVNLANYFEAGDASQNIPLQPEDRVFVPEKGDSFLDRALRVAQLASIVLQVVTLLIVIGA